MIIFASKRNWWYNFMFVCLFSIEKETEGCFVFFDMSAFCMICVYDLSVYNRTLESEQVFQRNVSFLISIAMLWDATASNSTVTDVCLELCMYIIERHRCSNIPVTSVAATMNEPYHQYLQLNSALTRWRPVPYFMDTEFYTFFPDISLRLFK